MRRTGRSGGSAQARSENRDERGGAWASFDDVEWPDSTLDDDIDWPDSTLDVDDAEFARAIAEGREQERDAA
jgi:hypothetical protein